jgi:hypothetical protein
MPTTTPPWAPDPMATRDLLRQVPRRWPTTTLYLAGVGLLFGALCWLEAVL